MNYFKYSGMKDPFKELSFFISYENAKAKRRHYFQYYKLVTQ